jgi:hypothetical protein
MPTRRPSPTDLSDEEWEVLENPSFPTPSPAGVPEPTKRASC